MREDPYQVLGIPESASPAEVKRAYRQKVRTCHPDAVGAGREAEFLKVQEAYEAIRSGKACARKRPRRPRVPTDAELELDPTEAAQGVSLRVPMWVQTPCPVCAGWGLVVWCPWCGGEGSARHPVTVAVRVPPGVRDGDVVWGYATVGSARVEVSFAVSVPGRQTGSA